MKNMKVHFIASLLLIIIVSTGCAQDSTSEIQINPSSTRAYDNSPNATAEQSTRTPSFTLSLTPRSTPSPEYTITSTDYRIPSETSSTFIFPTPIPGWGFSQRCLQILDTPPTENFFDGVLVLNTTVLSPDGTFPHLLYLHTLERGVIPGQGGWRNFLPQISSVSPDHRWLAYIDHIQQDPFLQMHVISVNGEDQTIAAWQPDMGWIVEWLDNERLLLAPEFTDAQYYGTMNMWNPFTGELQTLQPVLPTSILWEYIRWYPFLEIPIVMYDSTLTRGVYLDTDGLFILFDVKEQQIIWENRPRNLMNRPAWRLDGSQFAIAMSYTYWPEEQDEIYLVDREGVETQVTHLSDALNVQEVIAGKMNWSPDETRIAFWLTVGDGENRIVHLAVMDVLTGEVVDYCIPGANLLYPIWSPISQQIAVLSIPDVNENIADTVILDLQSEQAFKIADGMVPIGWMIEP
jgi:hypothetical protein